MGRVLLGDYYGSGILQQQVGVIYMGMTMRWAVYYNGRGRSWWQVVGYYDGDDYGDGILEQRVGMIYMEPTMMWGVSYNGGGTGLKADGLVKSSTTRGTTTGRAEAQDWGQMVGYYHGDDYGSGIIAGDDLDDDMGGVEQWQNVGGLVGLGTTAAGGFLQQQVGVTYMGTTMRWVV
jgi:hypothetical protein